MAVQQAQNVFTAGINKDLNPISQKNDTLTDALNATTVTFNGNELLLQNDMGNTNLTYYPHTYGNPDSTNTKSHLCEMVKLKEGYIPIGMKEFGDVIYIVSHNPIDNNTEIGSFPGPDLNISAIPETEIGSQLFGIQEISDIHVLFNLSSLQVGDLISFTLDVIGPNYISTSTQKKLYKPKFTNLSNNTDITKNIQFDWNSNNKVQYFRYPNIENGNIGLSFELEELPTIKYSGYKQFKQYKNESDESVYEITFNNLQIISDNFIKIPEIEVTYELTYLGTNTSAKLISDEGVRRQGWSTTISIPDSSNIPEICEFEIPTANIVFEDGEYKEVEFKLTIQPTVICWDTTVNDYCKSQDGLFIETITMDPIEFTWDLRYSIQSLDYKSIQIKEIYTEPISYDNIVASRNILYDLNEFLKPEFEYSPLQFGNVMGCVHYFRRDTNKKRTLPTNVYADYSKDLINNILTINKHNFRDVTNEFGSIAILWDGCNLNESDFTYKYSEEEEITLPVYHRSTLTASGTITPKNKKVLKTNLLGNLDNLITNNSKLIYSASPNNIGIVIYPGGPTKNQSDIQTGYINEWAAGGKRQSYALLQLKINDKVVVDKLHKIIIKESQYNIGGQAERDFSKVGAGIASFGDDVETNIKPFITNTIYFNPNDLKFDSFKPPINLGPIKTPDHEVAEFPLTQTDKGIAGSDTLSWISLNYKISAEGITPAYGNAYEEDEGKGANGILVYPTIGGFTTSEEITPNTMEFILDMEIKDITLPQDDQIEVIYTMDYGIKDDSQYKMDILGNALINQTLIIYSECQFAKHGNIKSNESTQNIMLPNVYTVDSSCKLHNKPSYKYITFACYTDVDTPILSKYESYKIFDNKVNDKYLHMYLINIDAYELKFNNKQVIVNPIYYQSNIYNKKGSVYQKSNTSETIDNIVNYDGGNENEGHVWVDIQLQSVSEIYVSNKKQLDEYFSITDGRTGDNGKIEVDAEYITCIYWPQPIFNVKQVRYMQDEV